MVALLIIADDFTGALDTGVQFTNAGAAASVVTDLHYDFSAAEAQVLVVDVETRHLSPPDAYETVRRIVDAAERAGVPYLYKKTDSGLRGNIGAELQAMLDASGGGRLHFVPALPNLGRVTVNGVQYLDGVPVAESVFGRDPFEPVRHSNVADILAEQTGVPVRLHKSYPGGAPLPGIHVYDAEEQNDIEALAQALRRDNELHLTAGCAGLAAALPALLGLTGAPAEPHDFSPHLLMACGSVNPITQEQLSEAEARGCLRLRLTPAQKLDPGWLYTSECDQVVAHWSALVEAGTPCILDANDIQPGETARYARERGLDSEQLRVRIAATVGVLTKRLLDARSEGTLFLTGGDTLLAFLRQIGVGELIPGWELEPGVVLSHLTYRSRRYDVISKSGGFGKKDLIAGLSGLSAPYEEETICCSATS